MYIQYMFKVFIQKHAPSSIREKGPVERTGRRCEGDPGPFAHQNQAFLIGYSNMPNYLSFQARFDPNRGKSDYILC